ncbi:MAG: butyrate kinase [Caldiserica bacterium]|jgi:butyrate kinase|nr:butyrate kinase [Caldisericota bacterium]MDH7562930.1 butyrate kinase [Caldisericota bacterium]
MGWKILVINPGSTSTKIAYYEDENCLKEKTLYHRESKLEILEELPERLSDLRSWMSQEGLEDFDAVVARGGLLKPLPSGTFKVNPRMLEDLRLRPQAHHASNLGAFIADAISRQFGIPAFIVDPVSVDEFSPLARYSGLPEIPRRALSHALNIKAVARDVAKEMGKKIEECNFVVAHLGGGISVVPLESGRIVDANDANQGGPFSPERAGALPTVDLVRLAFSGKFTEKELITRMTKKGGLSAYLGTNDAREVERRISQGDSYALEVYQAMAYQISKEIGAMATVLKGKVDRVIITGGLAYSTVLVPWIVERISFIAPAVIKPGEGEMRALALGALRVLKGEEQPKDYD